MSDEPDFYQGVYKLQNPKKYLGTKSPVYRSSWERRSMVYFDTNKNVIAWASENFQIEYVSPWDGKVHRYFPDIYVKCITKENKIKEYVLEIKPKKQCEKPKEPKHKTAKAMENYKAACRLYAKNCAKWEACKEFCRKRGYEFKLITENEIFGS